MQLVIMLLIAVSILTILSGIAVIAGSNKKERYTAIWFLLITVGATIWSLSVGAFLTTIAGNETAAWGFVQTIFISSIITMIAVVGNTSWKYKIGKIITLIAIAIGIVLSVLVILFPSLVFSSIELNNSGNVVYFSIAPCSIAYGALILGCALIGLASLIYQVSHARKKNVRNGFIVYLVGLSFTIVCSIICDLILPMNGYCALMWLGPVTLGTTMLGYYYAILRYHLLQLSSSWLKILTYVIIMASCAIVYSLIFFLIFAALFHTATPSPAVILLNFIMIMIVLLLMPVVNEVSAFVKSLASTRKVDLVYVIKKLNNLASKNVNLKELSGFLAEHMHFNFVVFLIDGRAYGIGPTLSGAEIVQISSLSPAKTGIWQDFNEPVSRIASTQDINAIAELRDAKGKTFGQIIIGRPTGKIHFERKDLLQFEMIINLVAALAESAKHARKG